MLGDGDPLAVPVWYRWDGSAIAIWTTSPRIWVRRVAQAGRAGFGVADETPPYAAALVRGPATVVRDPAVVAAEARAISALYMPEAEIEDYVASWADLDAVVRIAPERVLVWHSV